MYRAQQYHREIFLYFFSPPLKSITQIIIYYRLSDKVLRNLMEFNQIYIAVFFSFFVFFNHTVNIIIFINHNWEKKVKSNNNKR